jgi:hypothetical protein
LLATLARLEEQRREILSGSVKSWLASEPVSPDKALVLPVDKVTA